MKCFATTNSLQITAQGNLQPCCKFKKPLGDINVLDDYFTLESLTDLKSQHTNDVWTNNCKDCMNNEKVGLQSRREMYGIIGLTDADFFLDISMGNYCNLKCRMCGPENSTQWRSDFTALVDKGLVPDERYTNFSLTKEQVDHIIAILETKSGRIIIEVKGGEPLLMPISQYFFEQLAACKNADQFTIWMTSNLTKIPDWWYTISAQLQQIEFNVSMDGVGEYYNYIRGTRSSSLDVIKNASLLNKLDNHRLRFNIVVQNLNMNNLAELYDACIDIVDNETDISLIPLRNPSYYQPNVFPDHQKKQVVAKMSTSKIVDNRDYNSIVDYFMQPCDQQKWQQFLAISNTLDELRGQNLCSVLTVT
jgi:molybdenum cofactor biosynthesis enzyme MoaA